MLVLAFDTSTPAVTVALAELASDASMGSDGLRIVSERQEVAINRHGELLAPLISQVLDDGGAAPRDLAAIGVGLGSGPFTGLRVGIVTAKAMADALGAPAYGACSLDVLAERHRAESTHAVMTDARRKQVYWATYGPDGVRLAGPEIARPADLAAELAGRVDQVAGAGAVIYRDTFADFTVIEAAPYPAAADLVRLLEDTLRAGGPSDDLTPLYLRRPDAQPPGRPKQVTPA